MAPAACLDIKMQTIINRSIRGLHKLPVAAPRWGLFLHYGCLPLQFRMFKQVTHFWNSLLACDSQLISQMCSLACALAVDHPGAWLHQVLTACGQLQAHTSLPLPVVMPHPISLSWRPVATALKHYYKSSLQMSYGVLSPDDPDCPHCKHAVVCQWLHPVAKHNWLCCCSAHSMPLSYKQHQCVARFFCACAPVAASHHVMQSVAYSIGAAICAQPTLWAMNNMLLCFVQASSICVLHILFCALQLHL